MEDAKTIEATPIDLESSHQITLRQRIQLVRGKLHRFYVGHFNKPFVARQIAQRKGECARCGACCQLLFKCAFAAECKEGAGCKIYTKRPINCRVFPLHERDLKERDIVSPETKCGYYFD